MVPSRTVENYLKAILQAQMNMPAAELVAMGHIASCLGVTPGTATTMVKALSDAGLVRYEPYVGVRLSAPGEKLAALVLRRHRLIELFLVKVLRMSWAEVHDEAEQLEHAVSERLIEQIDGMLGRPEVDPHGDPIPGREGTVQLREYQNLLSCPLDTPVVVTRVTDQSPDFLRFVESSELKPGQPVQVELRDPAADAVVVSKEGHRMTIGMRAASKLLVEVAITLLILLTGTADQAMAQPPGLDASRGASLSLGSVLLIDSCAADSCAERGGGCEARTECVGEQVVPLYCSVPVSCSGQRSQRGR